MALKILIEDYQLKEVLLNRIKSWTKEDDQITLFNIYFDKLLNSDFFEKNEIDIYYFVDNLFLNSVFHYGKKSLEKAHIKEDDKRIIAQYENNYLVF